jgi:hypothetical protein
MANLTHDIRSSDTRDASVARADMKLERRCHPRPGCRPREGVLQEARVEADVTGVRWPAAHFYTTVGTCRTQRTQIDEYPAARHIFAHDALKSRGAIPGTPAATRDSRNSSDLG